MEMKINDGDWKESIREMGHLPILLRVREPALLRGGCLRALDRAWTSSLMTHSSCRDGNLYGLWALLRAANSLCTALRDPPLLIYLTIQP